jgi:hypothetical protein
VQTNSYANAYEDVLNLVESLYARDGKEIVGSQQNHFGFYGYISSIKRISSEKEWEAFRRKLYSHVTIACKRLQKEPMPEIYPKIVSGPHQCNAAHSPRSHARFGTGYPSRSSEPSSSPPPHQRYTRSSALNGVPSRPRQTLHPREDHTVAKIDVSMHNYTTLLKEHVDIAGGILTFGKDVVNSDPLTWRCVATLGDLSSEGTGINLKQAKQAASREMCTMLRLSMG